MMRLTIRAGKCCLLVTAFCLLAWASTGLAASKPAGTLRPEGKVYQGNNPVNAISAVFSGDSLRTEEGQATLGFSHGDFMVLRNNSQADIRGAADHLVIGLARGELVLSSSSSQRPSVDIGGLLLSSKGNAPGMAQIAQKSDGTIAILVHRGAYSVAGLRPEPVVISADQMLTVQPRVEQKQGPTQAGTGAHGKPTLGERLRTFRIAGLSHNASVAALAVGIGSATAAAITVPNVVTASPSVP